MKKRRYVEVTMTGQRWVDALDRYDLNPSTIHRGYGPGKFQSVLSRYIYDLSLDGCGDTIGQYTAVDLGLDALDAIVAIAKEQGDRLTRGEAAKQRSSSTMLTQLYMRMIKVSLT